MVPIMVLVLYLLVGLSAAAAQAPKPSAGHDPESAQELFDKDFEVRLQVGVGRESATLIDALERIESFRSAPSCSRHAVRGLVDSCQSTGQFAEATGPVDFNSEITLEKVKSAFAARLAMCELTDAGLTIPDHCSALQANYAHCYTKVKGNNGFFSHLLSKGRESTPSCEKEVVMSQLTSCLKAMESRPQHWTSYSNARQNAVVICQASREVIIRDQHLDMYQRLAQTTGSIHDELVRVPQMLRDSSSQIMADHEKVKLALDHLRLDLQNERNGLALALQSMLDQIDSAGRLMVENLFAASASVTDELETMRDSVQKAGVDAERSREAMTDVKEMAVLHTEMALENTRMAADTLVHMRSTQEMAAYVSEATKTALAALHSIAQKQEDIQQSQASLSESQALATAAFGDLNAQIGNASTSLSGFFQLFTAWGFISFVSTLALIGTAAILLPTVVSVLFRRWVSAWTVFVCITISLLVSNSSVRSKLASQAGSDAKLQFMSWLETLSRVAGPVFMILFFVQQVVHLVRVCVQQRKQSRMAAFEKLGGQSGEDAA